MSKTKLTDRAIKELQAFYSSGKFTQAELARMFKVGQSTVSEIVRREARDSSRDISVTPQ